MANDPRSVFFVEDKLTVVNSATVICARKTSRISGEGYTLGVDEFSKLKATVDFKGVFRGRDFEFMNGWEVLVGQSEVINYLKSTPQKLKTMRYGGEYKLAGGNVDEGETLEGCAKRELQEEFLRPLHQLVAKEDIVLRPFNVKQTRPVRSKSNMMNNFIALASENPWLANIDVDGVNAGLETRRKEFMRLVNSGEYWNMSTLDKELVAPEVHQLEWVPLSHAVRMCFSSMVLGTFTNSYQEKQFKRVGKKRRDPMFITAATLLELEAFESEEQLIRWSQHVDMDELRKDEQWLFDGMTNEDVMQVTIDRMKKNNGLNKSFKSPDDLQALRSRVALTLSKM